jgi:putative endonuclease
MKTFFVYIMASKSRTLYTGLTSKLSSRTFDHKNGLLPGFTRKYKIHRVVYFESFDSIVNAINREKQIKSWRRQKRVALITSHNPTWEDLAAEWYQKHAFSPAGPSLGSG